MTVPEPEFSPADLMGMLAELDADAMPRSSTGVPAEDAFNPDLQGQWKVRTMLDYAAQALSKHKAEYSKKFGKDFDLSPYLHTVYRDEV